MSIQSTIIVTAIALWIAHGWYLNTRLISVHEKLDRVLSAFDGLRDYLYEIDPQFDDERAANTELDEALDKPGFSFGGMSSMEIARHKKAEGKRTLNSPL
jgi:hypothetical protein